VVNPDVAEPTNCTNTNGDSSITKSSHFSGNENDDGNNYRKPNNCDSESAFNSLSTTVAPACEGWMVVAKSPALGVGFRRIRAVDDADEHLSSLIGTSTKRPLIRSAPARAAHRPSCPRAENALPTC
jgi:hypothetical protein